MAITHASELFSAPVAHIYLAECGERAFLQSGQFSLILVKNPVSQLALVVAMVGDVQWPIGRDSTVIRTEEAGFTFELPGSLTFELTVEAPSADLQKLEDILVEYSDYRRLADKMLQKNSDYTTSTEQLQSSSSGESRKRSAVGITDSRMMGRMLRARRMSAVAKVFSKSVERGAINVASHVEPMDTSASLPQISSNLALASVNAVAKVFQAVETGGRTLLESAGSAVAGAAAQVGKHRQGDANTSSNSSLSNLINNGWTLNKLGLTMLFRIITASMAIHSGGSSSGSSRSGSSSSSEFRRLLSSSSSSSSLSSKSPTTLTHAQVGGTTDVTSSHQLPATAGPSLVPIPPPPPFNAPRIRQMHSHMPPPSSPLPPTAGPHLQTGISFLGSPASPPIRVYKPRPMPAASTTVLPPPPPPPPPPSFVPCPPRFQPPPKS